MPPANLRIALQTGFSTVGYPDERCKTTMNELEQWYLRRKNTGGKSVAVEMDSDIESISLHDSDSQQPLLASLLAMESGHWFLFNADQPKAQQQLLKLSWHDHDSREFLFVNRRGQQIRLENASELITGIEHGKIRLLGTLDERPFFEQALENIASQLRNP
jgi:hypothetical protein